MCLLTITISLQSDAASMLEKDNDYRDEHFDFIQQHVRKFCLKCILVLFHKNYFVSVEISHLDSGHYIYVHVYIALLLHAKKHFSVVF